MEHLKDLINKLSEQSKKDAPPETLLETVKEIHAELLKGQNAPVYTATPKKISVIMPGPVFPQFNRAQHEIEEQTTGASVDAIEAVAPPAMPPPPPEPPAPEPPPVPAPPEQAKPVADEVYSLKKPVATERPNTLNFPPANELPFDDMNEIPTLAQHTSKKELHEVIAEKKESLNDKLKTEHKELSHSLKDQPIKDLRKGIAINDKFVFINDLFRGDEAMYDRSIKTINAFQIMQEAEYWMNRELKVKLGWKENSEVVNHFYDVVRRRFL